MIDHIGIRVGNFAKSRKFYEAALKPLGLKVIMGDNKLKYAGFGTPGAPFFWITAGKSVGAHVAFNCGDRKTVDRFYSAAIKAGGKNNGKPGVRKEYHPSYYGAFVIDPDGHNVEAVCHTPGE